MEPVSAAASIITILALSGEVIQYIGSASGGKEARKRLRCEIRDCERFLQELRDESDDSEEGKEWLETIEALNAPDAPLDKLRITLGIIKAKLSPQEGLRKKAAAALKWPFEEKDMEKILGVLESQKSLLQLALTNETRKLIQSIKRQSEENGKQLKELLEAVNVGLVDRIDRLSIRQESKEASEEREKILNWITPIGYAAQQQDYINRRQEGTGKWLLESAEYRDWCATEKRTLFCPGIPGAGKTILTSIVVEDLIKRHQSMPDVGIAYVYCNFRRGDTQKAVNLLESLLRQLVESQPCVPESVKSMYEQSKTMRPSLSVFSELLQEVASLHSRVFIVIDALDECPISDGERETFLDKLSDLRKETKANVFATSRFIPEIEEMLEVDVCLEICAKPEDVESYLVGHMGRLPRFVRRDEPLQKAIKTAILQSVKGMFLLVQLHLDSLVGKTSIKAVKTALEKLPTGTDAYDHAYNEAMERIRGQTPDHVQLATQLLSWVTCAEVPLTILQLQHALAVEIGMPDLDRENFTEIEVMISVCAGLLTFDQESDMVRLVHYTTQEYFERTQELWFPNAHVELAKTCVAYLSLDIFPSGRCKSAMDYWRRCQEYVLFRYATTNWGHHARKGSILFVEMMDFLTCGPKRAAASQAWLIPSYATVLSLDGSTGLHLVAWFGVEKAVAALLEKGADINVRSFSAETPLMLAARGQHEAVVKLLLANNQVDAGLVSTCNGTALTSATEVGNESIVALLLERDDVDVNTAIDGLTSRLPTQTYKSILELLCKRHDFDINGKNWEGYTLLTQAVRSEATEIVKILLKRDEVDVNATIGDDTVLAWAIQVEYTGIVELLLKRHDIDLNRKNRKGRTPLAQAVELNAIEIVEILLKRDEVDVNTTIDSYAVLVCALIFGTTAMTELLLKRNDISLEATDWYGDTVLLTATALGHTQIVRMLLQKKKVNVNHRNKDGLSPLQIAGLCSHKEIAQLLREHGGTY